MPATLTPLLRLEGITKRFGTVTALDQVSLDIQGGEIHTLLGENGAGKSTLIKILGGIHQPDAGTLWAGDEPISLPNVSAADRYKIRLIHQELSLAPNLTVAENIFLGRESSTLGFLHKREMNRRAQALIAELGLTEIRDVTATVATLSTAQQQLVEIARALSQEARVLVLDEPTSSLSELEVEALFQTLRRLRSQGVGIIYISHRMEEIMRLSDRITVLRDGKSVGTAPASEVDPKTLIRWMVGRDIKDHFPRPPYRPGAVALKVSQLSSAKVQDISFEVRYGEVLGLAGLVGAGRTELARALFGIDRIHQGTLQIDGNTVRIRSPRDALQQGMVLVPEDRKQQGLIVEQSVAFNISLPWLKEWIHGCAFDYQTRDKMVARTVQRFGVRLSNADQPVRDLSGGNQQKVLVGRWMEHPPKILILDEPTRGIDVGAREDLYRIIGELVSQGMALILISSDLDEVLNISHQIGTFREGRLTGVSPAESVTAEEVMHQLTGGSA
ncbi:sugar ABC transporter ATP-binding protein [Gimesia panareensis]|uniref:Ribose import ATP-binding protein RbsA n=1 Tax=Gimesia panareensis TaxID=2527978 RepID=A0A518AFX4_9PLAN|nr:sugar ABC transporter ATP-binding protein [Gimesia panareensis]QDT30574.1 Ribose import ATP-binding protein RbsA [Gimesia panareensis]QDU53629.1 Ribose import ATP-binding protein RbsA [Gimesia panareensis]